MYLFEISLLICVSILIRNPPKGPSINYVGKILPIFDPFPILRQVYYISLCSSIGIWLTPLSFLRSLWMVPKYLPETWGESWFPLDRLYESFEFLKVDNPLESSLTGSFLKCPQPEWHWSMLESWIWEWTVPTNQIKWCRDVIFLIMYFEVVVRWSNIFSISK